MYLYIQTYVCAYLYIYILTPFLIFHSILFFFSKFPLRHHVHMYFIYIYTHIYVIYIYIYMHI